MSFARPSKPLLYGKHFLGILDTINIACTHDTHVVTPVFVSKLCIYRS